MARGYRDNITTWILTFLPQSAEELVSNPGSSPQDDRQCGRLLTRESLTDSTEQAPRPGGAH